MCVCVVPVSVTSILIPFPFHLQSTLFNDYPWDNNGHKLLSIVKKIINHLKNVLSCEKGHILSPTLKYILTVNSNFVEAICESDLYFFYVFRRSKDWCNEWISFYTYYLHYVLSTYTLYCNHRITLIDTLQRLQLTYIFFRVHLTIGFCFSSDNFSIHFHSVFMAKME